MDDHRTSELWLGNLRDCIDAGDLKSVLSKHGTVHFCHIGRNPKLPVAYAKVTMGSVQQAALAKEALDGAVVPQLSGTAELKVRYSRAEAPTSPRSAPSQQTKRQQQQPAVARSSSLGSSSGGSSATNGGPPATAATARCGGCGKAEGASLALRRCSACKAVAYCSPACQLADWQQRHSGECPTLQHLSSLLARHSGMAGTLGAALQQPGSSLGRAVQSLLQARLAALEPQAQPQQGEQQGAAAPQQADHHHQQQQQSATAAPAAALQAQPAQQEEAAVTEAAEAALAAETVAGRLVAGALAGALAAPGEAAEAAAEMHAEEAAGREEDGGEEACQVARRLAASALQAAVEAAQQS